MLQGRIEPPTKKLTSITSGELHFQILEDFSKHDQQVSQAGLPLLNHPTISTYMTSPLISSRKQLMTSEWPPPLDIQMTDFV